ncbi:MAG: UDP-N-acetylmuramoyl-L-alanine--D-glutamate ligase [Pseudomonadota bacterium]|nr:UDP-N-acetylmuramoyl-L-alanine--D-glutamate ligase [Pseudomonadota bacterium]MED5253933.1 UDP-N-acetylmuramoyl-L-alanine--D-glutamate ligase [Pseudomonadota bacterium]
MLENYENIIIYGLGLSGLEVLNKLKNKKNIFIWDDSEKKRKELEKKGYQFLDPRDWPWENIDLLISSPGIPINFGMNSFIIKESKKNNIKIIGDIEVFYQEFQNFKNKKIIAVTGTNGKSTFATILYEILSKSGLKVSLGGNIGIPALSLNINECDIIIFEISSFQLELIEDFKADISILLNITEDHAERYESFEEYQKTKIKIFLNQKDEDYAILDNTYLSKKILDEINPLPRKIYFNELKTNAPNLNLNKNRVLKYILPALINVTDILRINRDFVIDELSKYKNLNHRIDEICSLNGINFVNDSKATNPAAANFAINQFNNIYWILGGLSKDNDLNKLDLSNQNIKKIFLIGSSSKQISKIIPKNINFEVSYNLENATRSAYEEALKDQKGCVLLSPGCSSQDEFNDYQDRGNMFTKIVNNLEVKC